MYTSAHSTNDSKGHIQHIEKHMRETRTYSSISITLYIFYVASPDKLDSGPTILRKHAVLSHIVKV